MSMRISDGEAQMLSELAEKQGISASDYIRLFIRSEHAKAFGDVAKPAKKKK